MENIVFDETERVFLLMRWKIISLENGIYTSFEKMEFFETFPMPVKNCVLRTYGTIDAIFLSFIVDRLLLLYNYILFQPIIVRLVSE